jgi:choline dehydrogenase-like flavoprotein
VKTYEADVAVVGSGICGLLAAWGPLSAGQSVLMLERGGLKTHAEQLRDGTYATDAPGARPNHQTAPGTPDHPWSYVYGVGGASLHWTGNSPRFSAADFEMRSRYGVMVDWPLGLDELLPYYLSAEDALAVAGAPKAPPGTRTAGPPIPGARALPAHPLSPMDRAVMGRLQPFGPLPQARPTRPLGGRPACCGSATCELCPVDSRFSALNGLRPVLEHPGLSLRDETVAARLRLRGGGRRVDSIEAIGRGGERDAVRAGTFVLAAGGFENPALLLRSGLDRPATGRYLFDHAHTTVTVSLRRPVNPGVGSSLSTGLSDAFREGAFRARYSSAIASPFNPGTPIGELATEAFEDGLRGDDLRRRALERWRRNVPFDVLTEDVPRPERRITLSPDKDELGLPLLRIHYPPPSRYERDGIDATVHGLRRRLAPLGVTAVTAKPGPAGAHLLGSCRMGTGEEAVVDANMRHLDVENLYVAGGSAFPTYSPVHPTLTIAALAIRLGEHLVRGGPGARIG